MVLSKDSSGFFIDFFVINRCRHITGLMDGGMEPKEATEKALNYMQKRTGKTGGAITISNKGQGSLDVT